MDMTSVDAARHGAANAGAPEPSGPARWWSSRVAPPLLGLLVVWQLLFMFSSLADSVFANGTFPLREEPGADRATATDVLFLPSREWAHTTLQFQYWSLFSYPPPRSTFPTVTLVWNEESTTRHVIMPSRFDSADLGFAADIALVRPFNYEAVLGAMYIHWDQSTVEPRRFQEYRIHRAQTRWQPTYAYMQLSVQDYLDTHPEATMPTEVVLSFRVFPAGRPGSTTPGAAPLDRPLVRWLPDSPPPAGFIPVEVFDPGTGTYEQVPKAS